MVEKNEIQARLPKPSKGLAQGRLEKHSGKVRDWIFPGRRNSASW